MTEATTEAVTTEATTTEAAESIATRKDWQAEAEKWKALARKHEGSAKTNAEKAAEFDKAEEARKTAEQKAEDRAKAAEDRVTQATQRAVRAEVKAIATGEFADPTDAYLYLGDLSRFIKNDGDIDSAAIEDALKEIEKAKPHLVAKARTDVGIGARGTSSAQSMNDLIRSTRTR